MIESCKVRYLTWVAGFFVLCSVTNGVKHADGSLTVDVDAETQWDPSDRQFASALGFSNKLP